MKNSQIPVLPLRDIVVFPYMIAPLFVGRELSINAINHVMKNDKMILLLTQKNSETDTPNATDLYKFGTLAKILQLLKLPDGTIKVLVEGIERTKVLELIENKEFLSAKVFTIMPEIKSISKTKALTKIVLEQFQLYQKINKKIPIEVLNNIRTYHDSNKIADIIIANLNIDLKQKQILLEITSTEERLNKIYKYLISEIDTLQIEKKIKGRIKRQMEKTQKEYYLNEQMKAIQKELGDNEEYNDIAELEKKLNEINLSSEAREKCKSELKN